MQGGKTICIQVFHRTGAAPLPLDRFSATPVPLPGEFGLDGRLVRLM